MATETEYVDAGHAVDAVTLSPTIGKAPPVTKDCLLYTSPSPRD